MAVAIDRGPTREKSERSSDWLSKYPPFATIALALFLIAVVLPSSLNLPQANPSTTPEYAPVPPDDETPPQNTGNLSSLGLPTTGGIGSGGTSEGTGLVGVDIEDEQDGPPGTPRKGSGKSPSTKKCVGNPPRQTEDPLSPPCVADFSGDNFGETYQGVTKEEIRILFYFDWATYTGSSRPGEEDPHGGWFDLADPPKDDEPVMVRNLRPLQRHFYDRYQTYDRIPHFYVQYGREDRDDVTPSLRRAEAADAYERVKPFAVVSAANNGYQDEYMEALAKRGVLVFGGAQPHSDDFFRKYAKLIWSYQPSIEQKAKNFSSLVCSQVVGKPVSFGDPAKHGQERVLGLLRSGWDQKPWFIHFAALVKKQVEECGGRFKLEKTFPRAGYINEVDPPVYARDNMQAFKDEGVTTIIWAEGFETQQSKAAEQIGYMPEWVVAGDLYHEGNFDASAQSPSVWQHAFVATTATKIDTRESTPCFQAIREYEPDFPADDMQFACTVFSTFDDLRQLFTGIQVAGPRLTPTTVDRGYHAIPAHRSNSPSEPACYYEPGDYSCIKDLTLEWWDPAGRSPQGHNGCWRMVEGGRRYAAFTWPDRNISDARRRPSDPSPDPCNSYNRTAQLT